MIRIRDVVVEYDDRRVLSEVSLDVSPGEKVAIMGANGSGKTTLLRLLAGLTDPDEGTIETAGDVGFAPEDPHAALFASTVAEEVAFFPRNRGLDATRAADRAMSQLEVADLRDRNPFSLSVGEQRRVSIAAVLSGDPSILALDEPSAGLDARGERHVSALLSGLDTTVVVSTHSADFAYRFADRIGVLADGNVCRIGSPREVLSDLELLDESDIRAPGIVTWAARQGFDRLPADLPEAVAMAKGQR